MANDQPLRKEFKRCGDYVHQGPLASGTTLIVEQGHCTIEGPVGDNVVLRVGGDVTLRSDAGHNLRVVAQGAFKGATIGEGGDILADGGVALWEMGFESRIQSAKGVAVNGPTPCGAYRVMIDPATRLITLSKPRTGGGNACPLP